MAWKEVQETLGAFEKYEKIKEWKSKGSLKKSKPKIVDSLDNYTKEMIK